MCGYVPKIKTSNDPDSCLFNSLCNTNYTHLTSNTWVWEELASNFPDKAFYYHRQTGFSLLFIRFVFVSQCLLGWTVCKAGIIRDGTVTGTHLIWRSVVHCATHTHTRHHTQTWTHMPEDTVAGSRHFCPPRVVLSVFEILCWAIKAAP